MIIRLNGVYGLPDAVAYYQHSRNGCFNFTPNRELATEVSREVADSIVSKASQYCKQFSASGMEILQN